MAKILLIEDDARYGALVVDFLSSHHFSIEIAETVQDALSYLDVFQFEILIVDWNLPDAEGTALIRSLRQKGFATPILMFTERETIKDKECGFNAGADDYLTKGVDPRELLLRVQALLRRPAAYKGNSIQIRDVSIDTANRSVTKGGKEIHLQPKEYLVLEFLARYPNRMFSADELLERLWPSDTEATTHTVRSTINKLRTKLDHNDGQKSLILTKYKAGYQINVEAPQTLS